jgi:hypothetical protein
MLRAPQIDDVKKGLQNFPSSIVFQAVTPKAGPAMEISQGMGPGAKIGITRTAPSSQANLNSKPPKL